MASMAAPVLVSSASSVAGGSWVLRPDGDDRVERTAARVPVFELADLDLDSVLPGQVGHARIGIHAEHPAARTLDRALVNR
jgi:hypothetical protein